MTLLELITVLAIVIILSLVSIPLFTSFLQSYRISAVGGNLYNAFQYARSEAIKQNTNVYVSFRTGDTWCYGINAGSACDCTNASSCSLGTESYTSAGQINMTTSGVISNAIYFEGTNGAANAAGTITFTAYGQSSPLISLQVARLGNVQVCATGIGGYSAC